VRIDEGVLRRLEVVARALGEGRDEREHQIAETIPAVDGVDGSLEWVEGFEPDSASACYVDDDPSKRVDYYNCISYRCVLKGAVVARLRPPTAGRAGIDVTGRVLEPRPGRPYEVALGDNLELSEDGSIVVRCDGLLEGSGPELKVSEVFLIEGSVDFSTGNIRFDGSTIVNENIGDRFVVRSAANVIVHGLVQAATIECGGSFICGQGMVGRNRGRLEVGGSVETTYLDAVRGVIKGSLTVRRELINCKLQVGGDLIAERAAVIGGDMAVGGTARIGSIGCKRGRPTRLVMASCGNPATGLQRIEVGGAICPGVRLRLGAFGVDFDDRLEGPLVIEAGGMNEPVFRIANGPARPLAEVARIVRRAA
jgi:uncharacterized protein (DUF342 family)